MSKLYEKSAKNSTPSGAVLDAGPGSLIVSVVRYKGPVSKQYVLKNGKADRGEFNHRSKRAVGETLEFSSFEDFATWRKALAPEHMLVSGTFEGIGEVPVVYKGEEGPGEASASKKYLAHRNQPGILIIDIDFKDTDEVAGLCLGGDQPYKTLEAAREALRKVMPEAEGCALMMGWSTSSNLFDGDGKQVKGTGGIRIYIPVTDASKIPMLLDIAHKRSWLHSEGWAFVGVGGDFHERSFVDKALDRPTQPDYAAPDLRDGLTQDREWEEYEGDYLAPASVVPLTAEEEAEYLKATSVAKNALAPDMKVERERWLAERADKAEEKGVSRKRAMSAGVRLLDNGILFPTDTVIFDDGAEVSVLDLLTDGAKHDLKTCKDPVEPDYNGGASVGIFYGNDGGIPRISSFAHGKKTYTIQHDEESIRAVIETKDRDDIIRALALSGVDEMTFTMLVGETAKALRLGNKRKVITDAVTKKRTEMSGSGREFGTSTRDSAVVSIIQEGQWPIDKPLPPEVFPFNDDGKLLGHEANYAKMLEACGIGIAYDMISKKLLWTSSGLDTETDNAELALFSRIKSLAALNGLPAGNDTLHAFLPAIAEAEQVNCVRDYLKDLEWDGTDRFEKLATSLGSHDQEVALISITRWLIQACAAADGAKLAQSSNPEVKAVFEYVLVLLGDQGVGKTKGLSSVIPNELRRYLKESVVLNTNSKDSVKLAVSGWVAELGELDATFRAADHVAFKAFMSREHDELRMPYAAKASKFRRRTVFVGSVNETDFLKDKTGGRRFFPLSVDRGFPAWPDDEVDQLWAQAWSLYASGEQWWPSDEETVLLDENSERFRQKSWAEQRLEEEYDWSLGPDENKRTMTTSLWEELTGSGVAAKKMLPVELSDLSHALRRLWSENGAYKHKGVLVIGTSQGTIRVNSKDGKHRGWLLPPRRGVRQTTDALSPVVATVRPFWLRGRRSRG
jgi:hypothetical protein